MYDISLLDCYLQRKLAIASPSFAYSIKAHANVRRIYSFGLLALDIHSIFAAFSIVLAIKIGCAAQNKTL
jgi:hypothetical protein